MAETNKRQIIQLYRNSSAITGNYDDAVDALGGAIGVKDGEIVLARYKEEGNTIKTALGVYHDLGEGKRGFTAFMNAAEVEAAIAAQGSSIADDVERLMSELVNGATIIDNFSAVETAIANILGENQNIGNVLSSVTDNLSSLDGRLDTAEAKLDVIQSTSDTQEGSIAKALKDAKDYADVEIGRAINGIDVKVDAAENKFLTAFEIENGSLKVDSIKSATFASANGSVVVNGFDLSVNVDSETIVLDTADGKKGQLKVASAALTQYVGSKAIAVGDVDEDNNKTISLVISPNDKFLAFSDVEDKKGLIAKVGLKKLNDGEVANLGENNVKEAYKLVDKSGNAVEGSDVIKIYKDSSVKDVHIGNPDVNDKSEGAAEGAKESAQKLYLTYIKNDGTEQTVAVDFSAFVAEAEAGNGLAVTDGVLNVVKDTDSEDFLVIKDNSIAVSGVQAAIDTAVSDAEYLEGVEAETVVVKNEDNTNVTVAKGISVSGVDDKKQTIGIKVKDGDDAQFGFDAYGNLIIVKLDGGVF